MGLPVVVVSNWGIAVTESTNGLGLPMDVATNGSGLAVTIVASGGLSIIFYGPDGITPWPGGVAPGGSTLQSDTGVDILADTGTPILVQ